ncbi:selenide, water dikinase SelD [Lutibaculum baratangense]|nr:selenide, water dikinase SelD [Lutibaculum baratangense]
MKSSIPIEKEIVLVGGGHAHVHVLKRFGMRPLPGVRLTLVADEIETPYSGMLPGLIAGRYTHDEAHIDLWPLATFAGARLIHARATGLDLAGRRVIFADRPPLRFDLLSLDIGSTARANVPGAAEHATPVRPVRKFLRWLGELHANAEARPLKIVVAGGGAGGVELLLSLRHRLSGGPHRHDFTLVTEGEVMSGHNARTTGIFRRILNTRNVRLLERTPVAEVRAGELGTVAGDTQPFDELVWTTGPAPHPWLATTGLELAEGFVSVDRAFRSVSHDFVFAVGDTATVVSDPRPKAGVFAVRAGPPLEANLRRAARGLPPRPFRAQRHFLSLISTDDEHAVASRGPFAAEGDLLWRWKDRIDRRWMRKYQVLPDMAGETKADAPLSPQDPEAMRCAGCGAKIPAGVLARVIERLDPPPSPAVMVGLREGEDAAVLRTTPGALMVQTVDFFRAMVSDPFVFGRIAANHALSDIWAMGADPAAALAIAGLPPGAPDVVEDELFQMLAGAVEALREAGATLAGGHSAEVAETMLGFAVTGSARQERLFRKGAMLAGDRLILTKPLGTGALLAAAMRGRAKGRDMAVALREMQRSSGPAAAVLRSHGARAVTDVTGFGLAGHLAEMIGRSGLAATVELGRLPLLPGALEAMEAGYLSTLHPSNAEAARWIEGAIVAERPPHAALFDPQTAGGLLAAVPPQAAESCLLALRGGPAPGAAIVGEVACTGAHAFIRLE